MPTQPKCFARNSIIVRLTLLALIAIDHVQNLMMVQDIGNGLAFAENFLDFVVILRVNAERVLHGNLTKRPRYWKLAPMGALRCQSGSASGVAASPA